MLSYIKGKVTEKKDSSIILENQGLGFEVFCSPGTASKIKIGDFLKVYTFLCLKKETIELYGFLNRKELNLFMVLNGIPGIGPRTASLMAFYQTPDKLKSALESPDFQYKGVGKKKVQKILLELTGKIKEFQRKTREEDEQVLEALTSLGFSHKLAKETIKKISSEKKTTEERLKEALQILGQRK